VASWIRDDVGQRMLEIGAGLGSVSKFFVDRDVLHLLDINPRFIARLKSKFRYLTNVQYHLADFTSVEQMAPLRQANLDTVVMSNVLEHFADDGAVLESIRGILPVGGKLVLIIPSHQALFGTLDVSVGHYRRYEHEGLGALLGQHGFIVKRHRYHNWLGALGWFVQGRIVKKKEITAASIRSFELLMSLARFLDEHVPLRFGQSLVVIAEKVS
jgi:SAM-dependent methyltransferase